MSTRVRQAFQSAAGAAGGDSLDVDDVFSTYLYTGNSSTQTISNGIDLAGGGGLVWMKTRSGANVANHNLFDTVRGVTKKISTDLSLQETTETNRLTAFNSDGFSLGNSTETNYNNDKYVSYSFRKTKRFFDIVTYTGNGTAGRTISHNLGSTVGAIFVKCLSTNGRWWAAYHKGTSATPQNDYLVVNKSNGKASSSAIWNNTAPTDSVFTVGSGRVEDISSGEYISTNENGLTYVAYLFAHNDGDGDFGPDGDQDIIKCGSYTGNGTSGHFIDIGFEPQWLMIKRTDSSGNWYIWDDGRSFKGEGGEGVALRANTLNAEQRTSSLTITPSAQGFTIDTTSNINGNNDSFSYMAIRRGSLLQPESATDVFAVGNHGTSNPAYVSGFRVDMGWSIGSSAPYVTDRLRGPKLSPMFSTAAEANNNSVTWDWNNGMYSGLSYSPSKAHMWRRAPGFFDVVAYTGNGGIGANGTQTITHNLGVAPEMIFVKARAGTYAASSSFMVYHSGVGATKALYINADYGPSTGNWWNNTAPTDTNFSVGDNYQTNDSASTFISYLFASLDGISKVGSYTGNGSSQTINCGFTNGARFVMTKRSDSTGNWNVWDAERGIVAGNDPRIELNDQYGTIDSGHDYIDPHNSGFIVNYVANDNDDSNVNGATYIFYAIA